MIQAFIFVHFHPREYLLAKKPGLDLNVRRTANEPGQIDRDDVPLVIYSVLCEVVRQELVVAQIEARLCNRLLVRVFLFQMVVVIR